MKTNFNSKAFKYFLLIIFLIVCNCKNNDEEQMEEPVETTEISRLQIVTITTENTLTKQEYEGKLGMTPIKVNKVGDQKLTFIVPVDQGLGDVSLVIPSLGKQINYSVKDLILGDTADNIVMPFKNNLQTFATTLAENTAENIAIKNSITQFGIIYQNSTTVEKETFARFYLVNKAFVDDLVLNDYSKINKLQNFNDDQKFVLAMIGLDVAVGTFALAVNAFNVKPDISALFMAGSGLLGMVCYKKATQYHSNIIKGIFMTRNAECDGVEGEIKKTASNIALTSGTVKTVTFKTKSNSVINADHNTTKERIKNYFKYYELYNQLVAYVNPKIDFLNSKIPLIKLPKFNTVTTPTASQIQTDNIDNLTFSNFKFSMNDANINLDDVSFNAAGKINLKASIKNTATGNSYNGDLLFTYNDEFNTFTGKLPITVNKENVLDGIWTMDFTLAPSGNCDEIDLEDEAHVPPTLHFNSNGTIKFDSVYDPDILADANNPNICTNTYEFENNLLKITVHFKEGNEETTNISVLNYNSQTKAFTGSYTYTYRYNGVVEQVCNNAVSLHK